MKMIMYNIMYNLIYTPEVFLPTGGVLGNVGGPLDILPHKKNIVYCYLHYNHISTKGCEP